MNLRPLRFTLTFVAIAAVTTLTLLWIAPPPHADGEATPPWHAQQSGGYWEIMGWTLGATTPEQVAKRLGSDVQWAILRRPGQAVVLEGWVPDFAVHGLTGKLLLQFELPEPLQALAEAEGRGAEITASGNLRREFDPLHQSDPRWRQAPRLQLLTFLPSVRIDAATLEARFAALGTTPRRWQDETQATHWLYALSCAAPCTPLGVHIALPAENGRPVIEYALLERFAALLPS
ncbi:MAG: hypothetical protein WHS85_09905 [Hydrogenophilus sp.]